MLFLRLKKSKGVNAPLELLRIVLKLIAYGNLTHGIFSTS